MKMKVIRPHLGDGGMVEVGAIRDVSLLRAKDLEQKGLAVPLITRQAMDALGAKEGVADKSNSRPTLTPPIGGPIGEAKPVLLSPPAQAQPKRKYTRRKAKPAP